VSVRSTLDQALSDTRSAPPAELDAARAWVARTEILLEWISQHPKLVEINCEAAQLLGQLRSEAVSAIDVDYRGIAKREKPGNDQTDS